MFFFITVDGKLLAKWQVRKKRKIKKSFRGETSGFKIFLVGFKFKARFDWSL